MSRRIQPSKAMEGARAESLPEIEEDSALEGDGRFGG
jgi:hypothetical protein